MLLRIDSRAEQQAGRADLGMCLRIGPVGLECLIARLLADCRSWDRWMPAGACDTRTALFCGLARDKEPGAAILEGVATSLEPLEAVELKRLLEDG